MNSNSFLLSFGMKPGDFERTEGQNKFEEAFLSRQRWMWHMAAIISIDSVRDIFANEVELQGMIKGHPFGCPLAHPR